ncbi:MAG: MBOAT family O-acyltransferase [Gammaproteobacteria bacterium]
MAFNSFEYLLFLPLVAALFYLTPRPYRWVLLLSASYVFYSAWRLDYLLLLLLSTAVDYVAALRIHALEQPNQRKRWLMLSVGVNLGLLMGFKYLEPALSGLNELAGLSGAAWALPVPEILLPIGISFYTFQTLSYTIDVYRGVSQPERHLGRFALYVAFFPQLVSGPIERSTTLLPQFRQHQVLDVQGISDALKLILWGFFLKLVVADRLALQVDAVFHEPEGQHGAVVLASVYLFAFQVFFDFAGYTNIAIGSAKLMGFDLMENFARPYLARSIPEFWQRWHMSLTSWIRDYVYFSMGGSRVGWWRRWFNLYVVFFLVAMWHGTDWKLALFGTTHFLLYVLTKALAGPMQALLQTMGLAKQTWLVNAMSIALTFTLVSFCWVIWWAPSFGHVVTIYQGAFDWQQGLPSASDWPTSLADLALITSLLAFCAVISLLQGDRPQRRLLMHQSPVLRWSVLYLLVLALLFLRPEQGGDAFIYFQF